MLPVLEYVIDPHTITPAPPYLTLSNKFCFPKFSLDFLYTNTRLSKRKTLVNLSLIGKAFLAN